MAFIYIDCLLLDSFQVHLDQLFLFHFFNPIWIKELHRVVKEVRADTILVRDLPLAPTAVWVGKSVSCPVIFDMAENYPLMLESILEWEGNKLTNSILRNPSLAYKIEQWTLRNVDHTMVVIEESRSGFFD